MPPAMSQGLAEQDGKHGHGWRSLFTKNCGPISATAGSDFSAVGRRRNQDTSVTRNDQIFKETYENGKRKITDSFIHGLQ
jgi:hypothetical protein